MELWARSRETVRDYLVEDPHPASATVHDGTYTGEFVFFLEVKCVNSEGAFDVGTLSIAHRIAVYNGSLI